MREPHRVSRLARFWMLVTLLGCGGQGEPARTVSMTDSAGIRLVKLASLEELQTPEWPAREIYSTEGLSVPLLEVQAGVLLGDGSLLISNSAAGELVLLGPDGNFERTIGRPGDGPGEFRYVLWLGVQPDGSILAYDSGSLRLTQFDSSWHVMKSWNLNTSVPFTALAPLSIDPNGNILATHWDNRVFLRGETRDTVPLLRLSTKTYEVDTIGLWPGQEKMIVKAPIGSTRVPIGFGRNVSAAGRGSRAAIGSTDSLCISVYGTDGSLEILLRGESARRQVGSREADRWLKEALERAPITTPEFLTLWEGAPIRETLPAFRGLVIDEHDRLWVSEVPIPGKRKTRWFIFSASGEPVAHVDLPRVPPHPLWDRSEVLDISGGRIVMLTRNEWDEEVISVLSFKDGGQDH